MSDEEFEYDIAISFHTHDEGIATQLNDLLQDRFKTFLYSKRQEQLVGKDGEEVFNSVFGKKARVVAIFYRKEWGETPFTRIEQTAIRNRAFDSGFDFTVFIPTEDNPSVPPWLPKTRIYAGLKRFGLQSVAGVIEARVQEAGGQPRVETLGDRAARYKRQEALRQAQQSFQQSPMGVNAANTAYRELDQEITKRVKDLSDAEIPVEVMKVGNGTGLLVHGLRIFLHVFWRSRYSNTLDGSSLNVKFTDGVPRIPELTVFNDPNVLHSDIYRFELLDIDQVGYVHTNLKQEFSLADLAAHIVTQFLDEADKFARKH